MSSLLALPIFGPDHANCTGCELAKQMARGFSACSYRPKNFNGLMIIGEGPGQQEVIEKRPFVGQAGKLLRALLDSIGLNLDECYIANATLCKPPPKDKALHEEFPNAIPSCLGRLEEEIAAVRPKVIVALGAAAWLAVSGFDKKHIKRVPFTCDACDPTTRKVGPVLQCNAPVPQGDGSTSGPCGHVHFLKGRDKATVDVEDLGRVKAAGCQKCGAKFKRVTPKMIKCLKCGGRKMRAEEVWTFEQALSVTAAAGGIFEPAPAGATERKVHEIDHWYAEQGVSYVIPTYHPAHILRGQQFLAKTLQKHFAKAKRLLAGGRPIDIKYQVTKDPAVVYDYYNGRLSWTAHYRWRERGLPAPNFTADTETHSELEGGNATEIFEVTHIHILGIGTTEDALVIDARDVDPSNPDDPLLQAIADFLLDPEIPKSYHHGAGYDVFVIDRIWNIPWDEQIKSYHDDSMFAHKNLYPDEPHNLGHCAFEFADTRAWKPPRTSRGAQVFKDFAEECEYNARDVIHTAWVIKGCDVDRGKALPGGRMARAGLSKIYEMDSLMRKEAIGMTMRGMPIDRALFDKAGAEADERVAAAENTMRSALVESGFGGQDHRGALEIDPETQKPIPCPCRACAFNFNSGPQLISLLFGPDSYFTLPVLSVTDKGKPSTDSPTLRKLLSVAKNEYVLRLLDGKLQQLKQQYVSKNFVHAASMQPWADGRIHPIWQPWGTKTGRFSSSPNVQNLPEWLRSVFVAPEGRVIIGCDEDQLELRGIAFLSGDKELIRRCLGAVESRKLEPDYDPHSFVASHAFGSRYTSLSLADPLHNKKDPKCSCETCKRKALRTITKSVIYAMNYGAGEQKIHETIYAKGYEGPPITIEMVGHVKRTIERVFPGIAKFREDTLRIAQRDGEFRSPIYGRRRIFPLNDIPPTEASNYPIQSLGADIVNECFLLFRDRLRDIDPTARAFIFAQVHDAVYVEGDEDKGDQIARLLEDSMTVEYERGGIVMPFTATAHVAKDLKAA